MTPEQARMELRLIGKHLDDMYFELRRFETAARGHANQGLPFNSPRLVEYFRKRTLHINQSLDRFDRFHKDNLRKGGEHEHGWL